MTRPGDITQQGKAVGIVAAMRDGEAEFIDTNTPLSALLEAEDSLENAVERVSPEPAVMAYLFGESPHPAIVMQKIYLLARRVRLAALSTLDPQDLRRLLGEGSESHHWRVLALLRGTRNEMRPAGVHNVLIDRVLTAACQRRRGKYEAPQVSLEALLRQGDDETRAQHQERLLAIIGIVQFIFFEGPAPELTIMRAYTLAKANHSPLIYDMTVRQMGKVFGCTGAAWSWRIKRYYNGFLESRGATGVKARFQKSDEACATYARAQHGNSNRARGQRTA